MRVIDERLRDRFLRDREMGDREEREFFSSLSSVSPLSFWIVNRLGDADLKEIFHDFSFNEERIELELQRALKEESEEGFLRETRRIKYKELLKLIIRDVFYNQAIEETLKEQSRLACLLIRTVYSYTEKIFLKGTLKPLTIVAMGKLGSEELNFSSDVDIVYVYDDENLENVDAYNRWAIKINHILTKNTDFGFLYRVDNDLRPGGKYSPLTMSSSAFLNYYYLYGETWQRMALLRAKFICGSIETYRFLFQQLEGYIFRRYLDFSMIKDLKELKNKIDIESQRRDKEGINIKLGKGGIREAEFFVYTFQIINGGKNKRIREGNIVGAIELLIEQRFLDEDRGKKLKEAYLFLRKVENYIQMDEELQKYIIPTGESLERLIKILNTDKERFFYSLNSYRNQIKDAFGSLFKSEEEKEEKIFIDSEGFDKGHLNRILSEAGIEISGDINPLLNNLEQRLFKIPSKYRKYYKTFILFLFHNISMKRVQKKHIILIDEFVDRLVKNPIYLPLLAENKNTINYIANVFFLGTYLVRILINYPETLEFIVTEDSIQRNSFSSYYKYLKELISSAPDFEMKMRLLRQFKNSEWLKIGVMESYGLIDTYDIELFLTNLAEASFFVVYELCKEIINEKMSPPNEEIAFIGMGKLGSYEMSYFSDIDLIFLYESDDPNVSYYNSKLMQRIISNLSMVTREGELYKVDMRLRPTGSQGPLVTSFQNFKEYHRTSWIFEKQALTRARVLGEDNPFNSQVSKEIESILYGSSYDRDVLKKEIFSMKKKKIDEELALKEKEKDAIEIKTGVGGLMDIEFIVQYYKLAFGKEYKEIRAIKPKDFFSALKELAPISLEKIEFIEKNYNFFKVIERHLRIISGFSRNSFLRNEEIVSEIIGNLNICMSNEDFSQYIADIKERVREIFIEVLNG